MINVLQRIRAHAASNPQAVAIVRRESDGSYVETTYGQLACESMAFAQAFSRHVTGDEIIPILAAKSAATVAALLGAIGSGHTAACLNPRLKLPQVERVLAAGRARVALLDGTGLLALKGAHAAASPIGRTRFWLLRGAGLLPMHDKAADAIRKVTRLEDWPVDCGETALPTLAPDAPAACLFTSGSTGVPKGVLVGTRDLVRRAEVEIQSFGLSERDVLLSVLPFSFDVGLNQLLSSLLAGATLVILDSWLPADILRAVADRGVTGISAVPSVWQDFLASRLRFDRAGAHRSLRYITVSGGDLKPAQLEALPSLGDGLLIFKTYGQTEVFRPTCLGAGEFAAHMRSVGRALEGSCVYVVREDGARAAAGEHGEVIATGLGVMLGYLDGNDEQLKLRDNPFRGARDPNEKAIFTGDVGYLDEGGYLHLLGRRDAMLKIRGNRVYPGEVAAQLLTLPGVQQAEVIGVDREVGGAQLHAFVVLEPDAPTADELLRRLASRVPAYMVPAAMVTLAAIPRTANGKPDYRALACEARAAP